MKGEKKLLLVCATLPPLVIGSTVLLKNIFERYPGKIEAAAGWEYGAREDKNFRLPFKTHHLRFRPDLLQRILDRYKGLYFRIICWFLKGVFRRYRPDAVFAACTPDGLFFTASYLLARKYKIPFYAQMHDLWTENTKPGSFSESLAKKYEAEIFAYSKKVFCMTEVQRDYYRKRYPEIGFFMLPHCIPYSMLETGHQPAAPKGDKDEKLILYTGNISRAMNLDALQQLVACMDDLPSNFRVKMLIALSVEECKAHGIYHERIDYDWVSVEESRQIIRSADVLFLPLSFKNCSENEVRTVYATKTLDYLTSGVPILVYSPPDSFHSTDARANGWGYVVEEDSPGLLAESLIRLSENEEIRRSVLEGAKAELQRRNPETHANWLFEEVETV